MSLEEQLSQVNLNLTELKDLIHKINEECGWHTNPLSGEYVPADEHWWVKQWALTISEMSEALEGYRKNLQDEYLPHRTSPEVELADTIIRILHLCSRSGYDIEGAVREKLKYNLRRADHKLHNRSKEGGKKF